MTERCFTRPRRFLSLLLASSLLCMLLSTVASARTTNFFDTSELTTLSSADLTWSAPDESIFQEACEELRAAIAKDDNGQEVAECYNYLYIVLIYCNNEYALCTIDYYRNPTKYEQDLLAWESYLVTLQNSFIEISREAYASKYGAFLRAYTGDDFADAITSTSSETEAQMTLRTKESALVSSYWTAMNDTYSVSLSGAAWTETTLQEKSKDLSYEEYQAIYLALAKAKNEKVGEIMVELVSIRNQYAKSKGYANYADYAYEVNYSRDYTVQEAAALCAYVKQYIVPVQDEMILPLSYNNKLSYSNMETISNLSDSQTLDLVGSYIDRVSSEYATVFDYMRTSKLYDISASSTKLDIAFTINLPLYSTAFLFNKADGSYLDVKTLTHEFGHFAAISLSDFLCQDVAEIHSQGLEALYMTFADEIAGEGGDAYRAYSIYGLLYAIEEGCLYDEFQRAVYTTDQLTVSKINKIFRSVSEEYGYIYSIDGDEAYSWIEVSHSFTEPFYYLSYATSGLSSLEILELSAQDFNSAADTYLNLTASSWKGSYKTVIGEAGLSNIFQSGAVQRIATGVSNYLDSNVYNMPALSDLNGHWSQSLARLCVACGIFTGDETGNFAPNGAMTRSAFVTTLWRLMGEPTGKSAGFSDVKSNAWYVDAVNWANENNIATGTGSGFSPDVSISREQLAVMLYRLFDEPEVDGSSILAKFPDTAQISSWGVDAMAWAVEQGLISGKADGRLDPVGTASRAETAAILARLIQ